MASVFVVFRAGENHGTQDAVGYFTKRQRAEDYALRLEWETYREEVEKVKSDSRMRLLSPDHTDYRRFNVEAVRCLE